MGVDYSFTVSAGYETTLGELKDLLVSRGVEEEAFGDIFECLDNICAECNCCYGFALNDCYSSGQQNSSGIFFSPRFKISDLYKVDGTSESSGRVNVGDAIDLDKLIGQRDKLDAMVKRLVAFGFKQAPITIRVCGFVC